jgi:hypothetical protein
LIRHPQASDQTCTKSCAIYVKPSSNQRQIFVNLAFANLSHHPAAPDFQPQHFPGGPAQRQQAVTSEGCPRQGGVNLLCKLPGSIPKIANFPLIPLNQFRNPLTPPGDRTRDQDRRFASNQLQTLEVDHMKLPRLEALIGFSAWVITAP